MNRIFYIMGKSASGKDSIYRDILGSSGLRPIILYTTRPMRTGEVDGKEYHFTDRKTFEAMQTAHSILEYRVYNTVQGEWIYFTSADSIDLKSGSYLGIGTLESYVKMKDYFGTEFVVPIYIDVEDGLRLERAVKRERLEANPKYTELCRRFISDSEDFLAEKIQAAGITKVFDNSGSIELCIGEIRKYINSFDQV